MSAAAQKKYNLYELEQENLKTVSQTILKTQPEIGEIEAEQTARDVIRASFVKAAAECADRMRFREAGIVVLKILVGAWGVSALGIATGEDDLHENAPGVANLLARQMDEIGKPQPDAKGNAKVYKNAQARIDEFMVKRVKEAARLQR